MGEKKVKGRKRHILTDTLGHLLYVQVHAANTHDTVDTPPSSLFFFFMVCFFKQGE